MSIDLIPPPVERRIPNPSWQPPAGIRLISADDHNMEMEHLWEERLPARFTVVGVARSDMTDDQFRQELYDSLKEFAGIAKPDDVSSALARRMYYVRGELNAPELYQKLTAKLKECGAPYTDGGIAR